jgi:hypothetical protein
MSAGITATLVAAALAVLSAVTLAMADDEPAVKENAAGVDVGPGTAFALPGIIRGGEDGTYGKCVFVYKLKKTGDVTIRVYDYNMSLVKTVVKGERRSAASSRSTLPERDFWDGTNNGGKRAWPGVYYFKITGNAGERLFGKVILAR